MLSDPYADYEKNFVPSDPNLAPEQEMFAKYPGPYSILSAGAGSGKTYTIQAKIDWLINTAGLSIKNILALSFTRTAATNLANRYPGVKSMTFDAFSADIFESIFPQGNQLVIADDIAVREAMLNVHRYNGFSNLNQQAVDDIIRAVTKATPKSRFQTTDINLVIGELTLAIINHQAEFKEMLIKSGVVSFNIRKAFTTANALNTLPAAYKDVEYLIIDEAQDSTQPETVMVLTLASFNRWRVAIVGDASQNISEWRGVSPKAFMESQHLGGFKNFTLQSNYRSVFPVLHAANQLLNVAETNETAQIQLSSPQPVLPLTDEFTKHIHLYTATGDPIDFKEVGKTTNDAFSSHYYSSTLSVAEMLKIISNARANNESVAVLARSNLMVSAIAQELNSYGADLFVKPSTERASTYRSETTSRLLSKVKTTSQLVTNLTNPTVIKVAMDSVMKVSYPSYVTKLSSDLKSILMKSSIVNLINKNDLQRAILSIQYMMIRLEAKDNAKRQQLLTNDDVNQLSGQDYVAATFHASKGLEWDHVIIIDEMRAKSGANHKNLQEELRLAYVAITRAKKQLHMLQLLDSSLKDPMLYANTKPSILSNPFGHAYILGLANTFDNQGQSANLAQIEPSYTFIEHTDSAD